MQYLKRSEVMATLDEQIMRYRRSVDEYQRLGDDEGVRRVQNKIAATYSAMSAVERIKVEEVGS